MPRPIVVIVGRQNVGKSTLFNRITGTRKAIVKDEPGVTRDRIYGEAVWEGRSFVVMDTGGFYTSSDDMLLADVKRHALMGIDEADVVIQLFDSKDGLTPADIELAELVRRYNKEVIWAVNKVDTQRAEQRLADFYSLGGAVIGVSAEGGLGFDELMDELVSRFKHGAAGDVPDDDLPKIAIVGRPNVGKSTLVNTLLGKEKMLVSPMSGTTRDSVDSICTYYGKRYLLIDTAGIRKKPNVVEDIERYSVVRAIRSIERADVVVFLIDATEGIVEQDKKIVNLIDRAGKGLILAINKWDAVEAPDERYRQFTESVERHFAFAYYAPMLTISGQMKKRITKIFPMVSDIVKERKKRITTGVLNRFAETLNKQLPTYKGKQTKVFYISQVEVEPPQFAVFLNYPEAIGANHMRYIEKLIRQGYPFSGTPIRVYVKKRNR
ncbi:MAG: ribosome biogenesis GTPase Der [Candidatus Magnetominusculus sp. LBB02]|nr:ribosome biogenesis GTPase Der [Candidatus Magnetominusculus sp. LBB02]